MRWTQTCSPAFYTYTSVNTSVIDQSCSLVFIRAVTANSFYQILLPSSASLSITIRDTIYGVTDWDSDHLVSLSLTQVCDGDFTPLYWNQVVQHLFCKFFVSFLCLKSGFLSFGCYLECKFVYILNPFINNNETCKQICLLLSCINL